MIPELWIFRALLLLILLRSGYCFSDCFKNTQYTQDFYSSGGPYKFEAIFIDEPQNVLYFGSIYDLSPAPYNAYVGAYNLKTQSLIWVNTYTTYLFGQSPHQESAEVRSIQADGTLLIAMFKVASTGGTYNGKCYYPIVSLNNLDGHVLKASYKQISSFCTWPGNTQRVVFDKQKNIYTIDKESYSDLGIQQYDQNLNILQGFKNLTYLNSAPIQTAAALSTMIYDPAFNTLYFTMYTQTYSKFGFGLINLGQGTQQRFFYTSIVQATYSIRVIQDFSDNILGCIRYMVSSVTYIGYFQFSKSKQDMIAQRTSYSGGSMLCVGIYSDGISIYILASQVQSTPAPPLSKSNFLCQIKGSSSYQIQLLLPSTSFGYGPQSARYLQSSEMWAFVGWFYTPSPGPPSKYYGSLNIQTHFDNCINLLQYNINEISTLTVSPLSDLV